MHDKISGYSGISMKKIGIIPFSLVKIQIYGERFIASAIAFPFRVGQVLCFGACDTRDANQHTGHPHPRGCGARTSHLTPGYVPCRLTACRIIATVQEHVLLWYRHMINKVARKSIKESPDHGHIRYRL
jgi:hypothetical protein